MPAQLAPALPAGCPWSGFTPPNVDWCEREVCSWIVNPADAWSNLAYLVAAVAIWRTVRRSGRADLAHFAPVCAALGAFSFAYHASYTWAFQFFDFVGMYAFVGLVLARNAVRLGWLAPAGGRSTMPAGARGGSLTNAHGEALASERSAALTSERSGSLTGERSASTGERSHWLARERSSGLARQRSGWLGSELGAWLAFVAVASAFTPPLFHAGFPIQALVFGWVLACVAQELALRRRSRAPAGSGDYAAAIAALAAAAACSVADVTRAACDPDAWLQGHALWHVLSAASLALLVRFLAVQPLAPRSVPA